MGGVNLDDLVEDLATIERYMREPDRFPGPATRDAFQRTGARIPMLVAEIRDHRANCARLIAPDSPGSGWFVRCPEVAADNPEYRCGMDWHSHDMLTHARITHHLHEDHQLSTEQAAEALAALEASGKLPKASIT